MVSQRVSNDDNRVSNNLLIFIEGNINMGKGQFIMGLARVLGKYSSDIHIHTRSPDEGVFGTDLNINDMLHLDPGRWAAEFLVHNLAEKLRFMKDRCRDTQNSIILIERSIATESEVFVQSLYDCGMISIVTYRSCVSLVTQISEMFEMLQPITRTLTYIYMRTDPTDLYESLISNNVYDCFNFKLLLAIHNNYETFIDKMSNDSTGEKYVVCVDVPHDQIIKPAANLVKNALKKLQHIYPALQNEPVIQH